LFEAKRIRAADGFVFDGYGEAEDWLMAEQYPNDYKGLVPRAPGKFIALRNFPVEIYVPQEVE
jgi:hypothetical protein